MKRKIIRVNINCFSKIIYSEEGKIISNDDSINTWDLMMGVCDASGRIKVGVRDEPQKLIGII